MAKDKLSDIAEQAREIKEHAVNLTDSIAEEAKIIYQQGEKLAKDKINQATDFAASTSEDFTKALTKYVKKDPMQALGLAALTGALLMYLLKRVDR